jgi:NAD(P)H-hydrate epimerase
VAHGQIYRGISVKKPYMPASMALVSAEQARALDAEAHAEWGLNAFALVEAAGRTCAAVFMRYIRRNNGGSVPVPNIVVLTGSGNNAADALVMLRVLLLQGYANADKALVLIKKLPGTAEQGPLAESLLALQKLNVTVLEWQAAPAALFVGADIIIDGIAGTGLQGPLCGSALELAEVVNKAKENRPLVVSIDVPSGNFDGWRPGMPILAADCTLAIEPRKICLYTPAARPFAGTILPVGGIFPPALVMRYAGAELNGWKNAASRIPPAPKTAHKYGRGVAEIRAGSPGSAGAAKLAALGAQAAGAGLVRLIVDPSLYPLTALSLFGIMAVPDGALEAGRFKPDAALLGPGWGRGADRMRLLESYLPLEAEGLPLILDADAIALAKDAVFHGNAVLTPHPGEFAAYTAIAKDELLADPVPYLRHAAAAKNVHILFKGHVLYAVSPDGRTGVIDGMNPVLAAGGTGDMLAGFCAGIAARQQAGQGFDGYTCMTAAAALLIKAAKGTAGRFIDPSELAPLAASLAGRAWLRE